MMSHFKTQEVPPEDVPEKRLLEEVDTSPELNDSNRKALQNIVLAHKNAFGLDGRLGTYDMKVLSSRAKNSISKDD